jgi:tricorn protease
MCNKLMAAFLACFTIGTAIAQQDALWMRYPAISPDGSQIVFSYKGDLYKVAAAGGNAQPLTLHDAHDSYPIWSRDGKQIAFASDRYGNFDVFVMPAEGGEAKRLTFNSAADFPSDFTPDNTHVLFNSSRHTVNTNVRFPSPGTFQQLYKVPVNGGRSILISAAGTEHAHLNSTGTQWIYEDAKGYEDPLRKHHTSSVTRDIWLVDDAKKQYRKISGFEGEDREPVWSSDDNYVFYLSEKKGSLNIFRMPTKTFDAEKQITNFTNHPIRHLSISKNNTLCFTYNGGIYTLQPNGEPKRLSIIINADIRGNAEKNVPVYGGASEFTIAPNGKEVAFVFRGEVFVSSLEGGITKRITNTPQQERMVAWSPDSKTLIYAGEREGSWNIYQTTVVRKDEPYFYAATLLKEVPVIATDAEEFQPKYSPDGKEIAYVNERNELNIWNIADKKSRTLFPKGLNFSYSDGDWDYQWSPNSKWILVESQEGYGFQSVQAALLSVSGNGKRENLTQSGYGVGLIKWALDGKAIVFASGKDGKRAAALQGSSEADVYALFVDQAEYDKFKLSKADLALWKEKDEKDKKADTTKGKADSIAKANWQPNINNLLQRKARLTINSTNIADYVVNADASKIFYYAEGEDGFDLWVTEPRSRDTRILTKLGGGYSSLQLSKDGKSIFLLNNGTIMKIDAESGRSSAVGIGGEMVLNSAGERAYIFEHAWRQVKKKFYDPKLHGIDWDMYYKAYQRFLPHINNNYDYEEFLSELLGELNASHTGGGYRVQAPNGDATASLGIFVNEFVGGKGLVITEIIAGGPLDNANTQIKAGHIIEKIDGEAISETIDWAQLLNRKAGKYVLLTVNNGTTSFEEVVKPITRGAENGLLYRRWVKTMNKITNDLSGGRVGYVHVQGMNDGSYRTTIEEVMGQNIDKEALIVDTRFNGGGWLHNDLNTFLSGKRYLTFAPQGVNVKGGEPLDRWTKPSCVLMSESNYSDAFIFPYIYNWVN